MLQPLTVTYSMHILCMVVCITTEDGLFTETLLMNFYSNGKILHILNNEKMAFNYKNFSYYNPIISAKNAFLRISYVLREFK